MMLFIRHLARHAHKKMIKSKNKLRFKNDSKTWIKEPKNY